MDPKLEAVKEPTEVERLKFEVGELWARLNRESSARDRREDLKRAWFDGLTWGVCFGILGAAYLATRRYS